MAAPCGPVRLRAAMQPAAPEGPWKVLLRSFVLMGPYRFGFIETNGPLAGIRWAHCMLLEPCCVLFWTVQKK